MRLFYPFIVLFVGLASLCAGQTTNRAYLDTAPDFSLALRGTSGERGGERGAFARRRPASPQPSPPAAAGGEGVRLLATEAVSRGAPTNTASDLGALLEKVRTQHKLPALAAAVVRGTNIVALGAVGVRKLGSGEKVTVDDKFHIGSCTKSMTATLAAMMVEDRTIHWTNGPGSVLTNVVTEMDHQYRDVPLHLLLRHRGGAPGDLDKDGLWGRVWSHASEPPLDQRRYLVRELTRQPPAYEPGTKFEYSNAGYALAGHMLETVAGQPWEELVRERLFKPLGMTNAGFGPPASNGKVDQPWGHTPGFLLLSDSPVPPDLKADNPAAIGPAGTVHCSIGDLARYAAFHLQGARGHGGLLKSDSFRYLHTPLPGQDYACGWTVTQRGWGDGDVMVHNGSNTTFFTVIWLAPKKDFAVVVATNLGGSRAENGADAAAWQLIQTYLLNQPVPSP